MEVETVPVAVPWIMDPSSSQACLTNPAKEMWFHDAMSLLPIERVPESIVHEVRDKFFKHDWHFASYHQWCEFHHIPNAHGLDWEALRLIEPRTSRSPTKLVDSPSFNLPRHFVLLAACPGCLVTQPPV